MWDTWQGWKDIWEIKGKDLSIHTKEFGPFPEANKVSGEVFRQAEGT